MRANPNEENPPQKKENEENPPPKEKKTKRTPPKEKKTKRQTGWSRVEALSWESRRVCVVWSGPGGITWDRKAMVPQRIDDGLAVECVCWRGQADAAISKVMHRSHRSRGGQSSLSDDIICTCQMTRALRSSPCLLRPSSINHRIHGGSTVPIPRQPSRFKPGQNWHGNACQQSTPKIGNVVHARLAVWTAGPLRCWICERRRAHPTARGTTHLFNKRRVECLVCSGGAIVL